uniref:Endoribonuclease n=1 Tax=Heterorhabditis bacteriophora TaxID=37862 RepID=A0A1I7XC48_HETBA
MIHLSLILFAMIALCHQENVPNFDISNEDLIEVTKILRDMDENKAKVGQIEIRYQGHTSTRDEVDDAEGKETGVKEPKVNVKEEKEEVGRFLTTVLASKPWKFLYEFFNRKGKDLKIIDHCIYTFYTLLSGHIFAKDPITWRYWIAQLWFVHYSRARGLADTSGFEHVFMGEAKNGEISGMHSWLRFFLLERNATEQFDYKGFIVKRFNLMAALKFSWMGQIKRSGSFLIGTSPEFDMALYTLCFLSRRGRNTCDIEVDGCPLSITSYDLTQNNKVKQAQTLRHSISVLVIFQVFIGSVFPSAGRITEKCRRSNG